MISGGSQSAPAVVVGLCAHGLAITRSLHRAGIRVIALETNKRLPGTRTNSADVRVVADINNEGLIKALVDLSSTLGHSGKPVLFLTNDRMVETIGVHSELVLSRYRVSWAGSRAAILPLLRKDCIEQRCRETGLNYPRTALVTDLDSLANEIGNLRFPLIVKPTRPISTFKTILAQSLESLVHARPRMARALPVIVQEYVPGDDTEIRFGALYLDAGRIVARFEGRKLRSRPMGHTTIAVSERDDKIHQLAMRFFQGLSVSGPVSLELKRGPDGDDWVIEPTVGRTDFWVGLCIANNVDLPVIEYMSVIGNSPLACVQNDSSIWINGERDPGAVAWLLARAPRALWGRRLCGVYASRADIRPFVAALREYVSTLPTRIGHKAKKVIFGPPKPQQ